MENASVKYFERIFGAGRWAELQAMMLSAADHGNNQASLAKASEVLFLMKLADPTVVPRHKET